MPTITIVTPNQEKTVNVEKNKRLVRAIEDADVDISHRCGGYAGCTTCRVEFLEGEPETMTQAEMSKLKSMDLLNKYRLSCQILATHDMKVKPVLLVNEQEWDTPGKTPEDYITPEPEWIKLETVS